MAVNPNFGTGKTGGGYSANIYPVWNTEDMGMIGKIAYSVIRDARAYNPLAVFDKMPVDNGDTIEQVVVKLLESRPYDPDGRNALTPKKRDELAVRYFNDWTEKTFDRSIYYNVLRYVSGNVSNKEEIASMLVSGLSQSDEQENYENVKALLKFGTVASGGTSPLVNLGTIPVKNGTVDYLGILTFIKNTVKGMRFTNTTFNSAGIKRKTENDDIFIIAPYKLMTQIDVESLSGVFNLSKAEVQNRIIEIDEEPDSDGNYTVYVVDRNAILVVTRLFTLDDQKNADGRFWNYFLQTSRLYAISPLFDGAFFKVATTAPANVQNIK